MTSVSPYAAWLSSGGSTAWAMLGYGAGEIEFDDQEAGRQVGDSAMTTAAVGGSLLVASNGSTASGRSARLAVEADAALSRFEIEDNGDRIEGVEVETQAGAGGGEGREPVRPG